MRLMFLGAAAAFWLAWLLPNHYYPLSGFWQDCAAGAGMALLFWSSLLAAPRSVRVSSIVVVTVLAAAIPVIQWFFGLIFFGGDALIAWLYLTGFGLAVAVPSIHRRGPEEVVLPALWAALLASIASVGLASMQWLDIGGLGIFLADFPPGSRPYANLAQPNQLATLLMLGQLAAIALYERRVLGNCSVAVVSAWLLFGLAMTQSRTVWAAMPILSIWLLWMSRRANFRLQPMAVFALGGGYAVLVSCWPGMSEALLLVPARTLAEQFAAAGGRLDLWSQVLDAIGRQPGWGYGWNQASVAQIRVAAEHPPTGQWIEDSHNLVLELLVMQGVPLGLLMVGSMVFWLWRRMRICRDKMVATALGAVLVVGVHAMVEFPLDYAYFLLPVGLVIGYIEVRSPGVARLSIPSPALWCVALIATLVLARAGYEYMDIERRNRAMRFEQAGFGPQELPGTRTPVYVLTQLEELPWFAGTLARRNMPLDELDRMRKMAERYAYPPVLFRFALAAGLNGDPETAARMLRVLCHVHSPDRCDEGRVAWRQMAAATFPELQFVPFPVLPEFRPERPIP